MSSQDSPIVPGSMSKAQIDRLGDRLRDGTAAENDYLLLGVFRESFEPAYREVVELIQTRLRLSITGRPGKTTPSIVAKLRRFRTRLSQMQDVAGCRLVVQDPLAQERALAWLASAFPGAAIIDRRERPSHGYRAIHVIPVVSGKPVEIQLRTKLQHLWAELSESLAFRLYVGLKYGEPVPKGPALIRVVRLIREAILQQIEDESERAEMESTLDDPQAMSQIFDRVGDETKDRLSRVEGMLEQTRTALDLAGTNIRTVETMPPGHQASEALARMEREVNELISTVELLA